MKKIAKIILPIGYLSESDSDKNHYEKVTAHNIFFYGATGFILDKLNLDDMSCSARHGLKSHGFAKCQTSAKHTLQCCFNFFQYQF